MRLPGHPILSCAAARDLEAQLFGGDEAREWEAMTRAGAAIGRAILRDIAEIGGLRPRPRILVLAGKGHNGGDALLAAEFLLRAVSDSTADVVFALGESEMRPLAIRAVRQVSHFARDRLKVIGGFASGYDVCLDGVFGFQFRPPMPPEVARLFAKVAEIPVRLRVAVDLPSGLAFQADFTYATGSVKLPCVDEANAAAVGRLRYLDLGFWDGAPQAAAPRAEGARVLTAAILDPLRDFRDPRADKRAHGHLFVVAGSRSYPGAALLTVLAALRSGAGLVTAFAPEHVVPAFAARAPGAIWIPWPANSDGGHALAALPLLEDRIQRATAIAIGPGMGEAVETLSLIERIAQKSKVPLVLDADALRPKIVRAGKAPRILTPHAGELLRLNEGAPLRSIVVEKGRLTKVRDGKSTYYSAFGGPVLARGGSGDILTGIIGGLLAQAGAGASRRKFSQHFLLSAAAQGVVWQGLAADLLAQTMGQRAVEATDLLDFMGPALRSADRTEYPARPI